MKQSPLKRKTAMPRSKPLEKRSKKRRLADASAAMDERRAWGQSFDFCWLCLRSEREIELHIHEIASRAQSSQCFDVRSLFRACRDCNCQDLDWLPEGLMLALKRRYDPENYDRVFVNRARGRADNAISDGEVRLWSRFMEGMMR